MTRDEVRDLLQRTLLTRDCPTGLRALRRRVSRRAAAMFAALFSASAFLTGCATSLRKQGPSVKVSVEQATTPQPAVFTGIVQEVDGYAIPGVTVLLRDEATQREIVVATDENGGFAITGLNDGIYRVEARLDGQGSDVKPNIRAGSHSAAVGVDDASSWLVCAAGDAGHSVDDVFAGLSPNVRTDSAHQQLFRFQLPLQRHALLRAERAIGALSRVWRETRRPKRPSLLGPLRHYLSSR